MVNVIKNGYQTFSERSHNTEDIFTFSDEDFRLETQYIGFGRRYDMRPKIKRQF